jgi:hypothetical protein
MRTLFVRYPWGWDIRIWPFGWLTYSKCSGERKFYFSPDATPCHERAIIFWRGRG